MTLAQKIMDNERKQLARQNKELVRQRLQNVVYAYPKQVIEVLHKTGVSVGAVLPSPVLYAVVVKNLSTNSELRDTIAKMILETDGYSSADGQGWQLVGGALAAVGSVLSGIGRGKTEQASADSQLQKENQQLQQQIDMANAQRQRTMWLTIGIAAVVITAIVWALIAYKNKKNTTLKLNAV